MVCNKRSYSSAFTIVELLIVIVVIGILAAITIVAYNGIQGRAIAATLQSDLDNAAKQLELYQVDNSAYPTSNDCSASPVAGSICLKSSSGNSYTDLQTNNTSNPQGFCLTAVHSGIGYRITNDSTPVAGTCSDISATGGVVADSGGYRTHTFTSSGTFTVTAGSRSVEILVVGGGGGGGGGNSSGGGGGGGLRYNAAYIVTTGSVSVVVGIGGSGGIGLANGSSGGSSFFDSYSVSGGGGGAQGGGAHNGVNGGSGGGAAPAGGTGSTGGSGNIGLYSPVEGYRGGDSSGVAPYPAGGGGGAGGSGVAGLGSQGGRGGNGLQYFGTYYAGGGGASLSSQGSAAGSGGLGGGGTGGGSNGSAAIANTGGGGGGGTSNGGNGGTGVVIIRYPTP